jgi:hypothetical protein
MRLWSLFMQFSYEAERRWLLVLIQLELTRIAVLQSATVRKVAA